MEALAVTLALAALALAAAALAVALVLPRRRHEQAPDDPVAGLPTDVEGLRAEVATLKADVRETMRHLAVVRYDAFGDMGGHLSWSIALLDDRGDGVVLTSIHGRSEVRSYAKSIEGWTCDQQLSPEEIEAVAFARKG